MSDLLPGQAGTAEKFLSIFNLNVGRGDRRGGGGMEGDCT